MTRQILLSFEDPWYIIKDIDTGVVSQGETVEEARNNLKEALELFFEDEPEGIPDSETYYIGTLEVSA